MIYFISDLHLGASYLPRRESEARVVRFLEQIADDATQLYLLGDILDYWYEYRHVVPRGFVRFFGALARLADSGVKITWLTGNHDIWLFDYLREQSAFLHAVLGPGGDARFAPRLREAICENLVQNILHEKYRDNPTPFVEYYVAFYAAAYLGIIACWIERGTPESSEDMARIATRLFFIKPGESIEL